MKSLPYGESHAILTLLTPEGTVALMARGAKKPQSRLAAAVQMCAHGMYSIYQGNGMGTLKQAELINSNRKIQEQLELAAYAAYFCELVLIVSEPRPNGSALGFRFLQAVLKRMGGDGENPSTLARVWETKVLQMLGAAPDWTHCIQCQNVLSEGYQYSPRDGGFLCAPCRFQNVNATKVLQFLKVPHATAKVLAAFSQVPIHKMGNINVSETTLTAVKQVLAIQLKDFAGVYPKSRQVLESLQLDVD